MKIKSLIRQWLNSPFGHPALKINKSSKEINPLHLQKIKAIFPRLEISSVRVNTDGFINDLLIVNEDLVFRFPRKSGRAAELFTNEIKIIELARKYVEIPLPQFEYKADDLVVYQYIKGIALRREDILKLTNHEQEKIIIQLAVFLKQFHEIPQFELKQNKIAQSKVNGCRKTWLKLFKDVEKELFPSMMPHIRESVREHFMPILTSKKFMDYEPQLIRGDITPYHIIYDPRLKQINGIIDFGTAGIGDSVADFTSILYDYGETFLAKMTKTYPEIENAIDRTRFWAGTLPLEWALNGWRT